MAKAMDTTKYTPVELYRIARERTVMQLAQDGQAMTVNRSHKRDKPLFAGDKSCGVSGFIVRYLDAQGRVTDTFHIGNRPDVVRAWLRKMQALGY